MRRAVLAALFALALGGIAGPAVAQNTGCVLDNCADKRAPAASTSDGGGSDRGAFRRTQPTGPSRPGDFDFYVLSLSWSPGFCATGGSEKGRAQCEPGAGKNFVVHGLWPQYEQGFPQDCGPGGRMPSRVALDAARDVYPDEQLARYEWRKHGVCSGKSPSDYFADVRRARDTVTVPTQFSAPRADQTWAPVDIARAFEAANSRLRPGMSAIECKDGTLQEVRFCMSKDLREFRACPEVSRRTCRTKEIRVPAPL